MVNKKKTAKAKPGSCIHARRQYSVQVLTLISQHLRHVGGHGPSEAVPAHPALSLLSQLRPQMHAKYPWRGPLMVAAGVRDNFPYLHKHIRSPINVNLNLTELVLKTAVWALFKLCLYIQYFGFGWCLMCHLQHQALRLQTGQVSCTCAEQLSSPDEVPSDSG